MKPTGLSGFALLLTAVALASTSTAATAHAKSRSITVRPGESIQAAVDAARPGDTVKVLAGDYYEPATSGPHAAAVYITKPLRLMASGPVRILPSGSQTSGIVVEGTADNVIDGVEVKGFTVEGFANNGIWLEYVHNFNIENNVSINNEENGIWPTLSANGQVKKNVAYGSKDSAMWIEASQNVRVIDNDLHHSPTGLEVTLSKDLTIENNNVHDNTVGIGLYHPAAAGLPQAEWPAAPYGNWRVANNHVHHNNEPNAAEGGEVALLPPGLGVLLLGVDAVDVWRNRIEGNNFVGVGMLDWCVAIGDPYCQVDGSVPNGFEDTALDNVSVIGNKFAGNHTEEGPPPFGPYAADILYVDGQIWASPDLGGFEPLTAGSNNVQCDNKLINTAGNPDPLVISLPPGLLAECRHGHHGNRGDGHDQDGSRDGGHHGGG